MKTFLRICTSLILVTQSAVPCSMATNQALSCDEKKAEAIELRSLWENGIRSGSLPEGMVMRVSACLGAAIPDTSGGSVPEDFCGSWEFTSKEIHRVVIEETEEERLERRESRPFNSKDLCKILLEGKAIEIEAKKGQGPKIGFVGTSYQQGSRSIQVVWNEKVVLDLHEYNTVAEVLYRESDARAFSKLYERLLSQAQEPFKSKPRDVK